MRALSAVLDSFCRGSMSAPLPSAHSKIGASVAERFFNCPGSVRECAKVPNTTSKYAAEGTVAHTVFAGILLEQPVPAIGARVEQDGLEIEITDEMVDAVQVGVEHVNSMRSPSDTVLIEHGFHLKQLHPDLYGRADCAIWKPYSRALHVIDYKHGAGKPVPVERNKQLRYYALGALLSSGFKAREVTVWIVQPRCEYAGGAIRSETFEAFDLMEWAADLLDAVRKTEDPNAPLIPGDHCRGTFCPVAATCPALHERALAVAQLQFTPSVPYDPAKLKFALDSRDAIKAFVKALDEFAYAEAMAGRLPDEVGYKLVAKRANRKWKDETEMEVVAELLTQSGLTNDHLYEPKALLSPAKVEKLIGKKQFATIEKEHVVKESSGYALAPVDDKRPAVRVLDAKAVFLSDPLTSTETNL